MTCPRTFVGWNLQQSTALCPQSRSVSVRKSRISACSISNKHIVSSRPLAQDYVYRGFYNSHSPHALIAFIFSALLVDVATPRRVLPHLLSRTCKSHFTNISWLRTQRQFNYTYLSHLHHQVFETCCPSLLPCLICLSTRSLAICSFPLQAPC